MMHSLPRSRAQARRVPINGLPSASLHASAASSASTQVIDRLIVPCAGIEPAGLVAAHAATAARQMMATTRLIARGGFTGANVACPHYGARRRSRLRDGPNGPD